MANLKKELIDQTAHFAVGLIATLLITMIINVIYAAIVVMVFAIVREIKQWLDRKDVWYGCAWGRRSSNIVLDGGLLMSKFAWLENGRLRDVCAGNPAELYHPDIAVFYSEIVPDDAENGDEWDGETLTKPEPIATPEPSAPAPSVIDVVTFKLLFTAPERVAIKSSTDPIVQDFYELIQDTRLQNVDLGLQSTIDALEYLESEGLISAGRADEILNYQP